MPMDYDIFNDSILKIENIASNKNILTIKVPYIGSRISNDVLDEAIKHQEVKINEIINEFYGVQS